MSLMSLVQSCFLELLAVEAAATERADDRRGGASPWLLVFVTHHPELLLLDCGKSLVLVIRVFLVNNVTGVELGLGEHSSSSSVTVPSAAGAGGARASGCATYRGHLACSRAISQATLAVEGTVRLLDRLKGRISFRRCDHIHLHNVKVPIGDTLLEPEDLEVLGEGCDTIVCEVSVKVVLLHVQLDVRVECEVASVTLIPEGLKL
jgi:hypothetical protein